MSKQSSIPQQQQQNPLQQQILQNQQHNNATTSQNAVVQLHGGLGVANNQPSPQVSCS